MGQMIADLVLEETSAHTLQHTLLAVTSQYPGDCSLDTTRLYSQPSVEQLNINVYIRNEPLSRIHMRVDRFNTTSKTRAKVTAVFPLKIIPSSIRDRRPLAVMFADPR